jgi:hypothetical protein
MRSKKGVRDFSATMSADFRSEVSGLSLALLIVRKRQIHAV